MGGSSLLVLLLIPVVASTLAFNNQKSQCYILTGGRVYPLSSTSSLHRSTPRWKKSTCLALQGQINTVYAECPCCPPPMVEFRNDRKMSKVDLVAFILLLFIVDMFIFSFTF